MAFLKFHKLYKFFQLSMSFSAFSFDRVIVLCCIFGGTAFCRQSFFAYPKGGENRTMTEKMRLYHQAYRQRNAERIRVYQRQYRRNNPERVKQRQQNYILAAAARIQEQEAAGDA